MLAPYCFLEEWVKYFSSSFCEIFWLRPKLVVLEVCMQRFMTSKNGKFRNMRSSLRPRRAVFGDFHWKRVIFEQNWLRAVSKMTAYFWIFHSLRSWIFAYALPTLQASASIKKSRKMKMKNFELQSAKVFGSTVLYTGYIHFNRP